MERGWVGRIDGEQVIQLAAQTLQALFTGGGTAREHAEFPLAGVKLLAPVLQPPAVRIFEDQSAFSFANPAAVLGPETVVPARTAPSDTVSQGRLSLLPRLACVVGAEGGVGGFTVSAEWRRSGSAPPKDRDFALGLGPAVVTPDELDPDGLAAVVRVDDEERLTATFQEFDWEAARALAIDGTTLRPGDLLVGPALEAVGDLTAGNMVELEVAGIGILAQTVAR